MTKLSATGYMRKAARALDEARLLLREQATEGTCSRAYYAMHDAAHAALIAVGYETPEAIMGLVEGTCKNRSQAGGLV